MGNGQCLKPFLGGVFRGLFARLLACCVDATFMSPIRSPLSPSPSGARQHVRVMSLSLRLSFSLPCKCLNLTYLLKSMENFSWILAVQY